MSPAGGGPGTPGAAGSVSPRFAPSLVAGALAGLAGGFFGVGGGIILVPMLTGRFGLTQHQAHGTSLAVIGATALVSVVVYALHGNVAWGTAILLAAASVFGARWGARLAARTPSELLTRTFSVFLAVVAVRLLWSPPLQAGAAKLSGAAGAAVDLVIGSVAGVLAGYMGVGGGIVAVPALTLVLGMSQQLAQGTSLAMILATAPAGALEHHRHGNVAVKLIPPFALGALAGGPLASLLVQQVPQRALSRAFGVFLILNAVHLWNRARRRRRAG